MGPLPIEYRSLSRRDPRSAPGQVRSHTLRHDFATNLLRETKNIRLTQKALGHASLATTMIYTHISDVELESAMRRR